MSFWWPPVWAIPFTSTGYDIPLWTSDDETSYCKGCQYSKIGWRLQCDSFSWGPHTLHCAQKLRRSSCPTLGPSTWSIGRWHSFSFPPSACLSQDQVVLNWYWWFNQGTCYLGQCPCETSTKVGLLSHSLALWHCSCKPWQGLGYKWSWRCVIWCHLIVTQGLTAHWLVSFQCWPSSSYILLAPKVFTITLSTHCQHSSSPCIYWMVHSLPIRSWPKQWTL